MFFLENVKKFLEKYHFLISVFLIATLPLIIVMYLTFTISEKAVEKEVYSTLLSIADDKSGMIDNYVFDSQLDAEILAHMPEIIDASLKVNSIFSKAGDKEMSQAELEKLRKKLIPYITYFIDLERYEKFYLISNQNKIAFSISNGISSVSDDKFFSFLKGELLRMAENATTLMETEMSDFEYVPGSKNPVAFIAAPITQQGVVTGVVALQINNEAIYKAISSSSGYLHSMEIIAGSLTSNSQIKLITPLKNKSELDTSNPIDAETIEHLRKAIAGEQKEGFFTDYQEDRVIGLWRYLPALRLGMIIKVSVSEAFAPIKNIQKDTLFLGGISIFLLTLISYLVSRTLQRSKEFLNNVINSMPSLMIILNKQKQIILWNQEAEKNAPHAVYRGQDVQNLFPYLAEALPVIDRANDEMKPQKIDKIMYRTPSRNYYFEVLIYPLVGEAFKGTALVVQDITENINFSENIKQQDKLASIGVLTAGIAHEINNPINFITANIKPLKNDVADILKLLDLYNQVNVSDFKTQMNTIDAFKQQIDLKYTVEEIDNLINGIEEGGRRTATIVKDLRTFSRLDEADKKKVNIQEGIDSTLTLLHHTYKDRITIIKEYGPIPLVDCYPGKLNQVFMNILSNAIQAIKDKGEIRIITEQVGSFVLIHIIDNGTGIKEEYKEKIFEPFFTTKEVGLGTGLGLSICYSIISEHGGTILVDSQEGVGSKFTIKLPL